MAQQQQQAYSLPNISVDEEDEGSCCSLALSVTATTRTVSFASLAAVHEHLSHRNFSDDEWHASWYTQDEYSEIQRRCKREIRKLENGETLHDKKYCALGLDCRTQIKLRERLSARYMSISAVLEEQTRQYYNSDCVFVDHDAIANVYQLAIKYVTRFHHRQGWEKRSQEAKQPNKSIPTARCA